MKTCKSCNEKHLLDDFISVDDREICKKCALAVVMYEYSGSPLHYELVKWNKKKGNFQWKN